MGANVKKQWPIKKNVEKNRLSISNFFIISQHALLGGAERPAGALCRPQSLAATGYPLIEATFRRRSRSGPKFHSAFDMNKAKGLLLR
jgi:hypothetical protein